MTVIDVKAARCVNIFVLTRCRHTSDIYIDNNTDHVLELYVILYAIKREREKEKEEAKKKTREKLRAAMYCEIKQIMSCYSHSIGR